MMKYLVQCQHPDGSISCEMCSDVQIIEMFGFRDCTDCKYVVYDVSQFGVAEELVHKPATEAAFH